MFKIRFVPSGRKVFAEPDKSILDAGRDAGIHIESPCNGMGRCGKCKVRAVEGRFSPFTEEESSFIHETEKQQGIRLACRVKVETDATVFVPEEYLLSQEASRKAFSGRVTQPRPAVKNYTVNLDVPNGARSDVLHAIVSSLGDRFGLEGLEADRSPAFDRSMTRKGLLPSPLTVTVWRDQEIIRVAPGTDDVLLGLALDIGTTTVALYLCDLRSGEILGSASFTNPEIVFGADVVARIAYSAHHPHTGMKRMREELLNSINRMIEIVTGDAGFTGSQILDMTVVGNTVMHHIFLGIRPDSLGLHPFRPTIETAMRCEGQSPQCGNKSFVLCPCAACRGGFCGRRQCGGHHLCGALPQGRADPDHRHRYKWGDRAGQ